jgi:hypothetical protein
MPDTTSDESPSQPVFENEAAAQAAGATGSVVIQEGAVPPAAAPAFPPGYTPPPSLVRELENTRRRLAELEQMASKPFVVPVPKRYRVTNLPPGGQSYRNAHGQLSRMLPGKLLDERYFDIKFIRDQGFQLEEVEPHEQQIGTRRSA